MKKVLFYGHFKNENEIAVDGQTSKTVNFFNYTKDRLGDLIQADKCNTRNFKKNIILNYLKLKSMIKHYDIFVILPGSINSLKVFKKAYGKSNKPIFYPVVGGWLADSVANNKILVNFLKAMKKIYPETNGLKSKLSFLGINNTTLSPTFTAREPIKFKKIQSSYLNEHKSNIFRFVYFGRISEKKGIYLAIDAIEELNKKFSNIFKLDFFGQKQSGEDLTKFTNSLNENIKYHGVMKDEDVWKLSIYDFFLFPTFYAGEGVPACCIESLHFGTPIIASNWKYNGEIVKDGKNGFLFDLEKNDLKEVIYNAIGGKYDILSLKENAYIDGKNYLPEIVIKPFIEDLTKEVNKNE